MKIIDFPLSYHKHQGLHFWGVENAPVRRREITLWGNPPLVYDCG